jgi:hypothetical protein
MRLNKKSQKKIRSKRYLSAIDKIQKVRAKNNANWMDILRLAINHAPNEAINLMKKINKKDQAISKLFNRIK